MNKASLIRQLQTLEARKVIVVLFACIFLIGTLGPLRGLNHAFFTATVTFLPTPPSMDDVVLITLDERDLSPGTELWDYERIAEAIRLLEQAQVRAIGLQLHLPYTGMPLSEQASLLQAIREHGQVALSVQALPVPSDTPISTTLPTLAKPDKTAWYASPWFKPLMGMTGRRPDYWQPISPPPVFVEVATALGVVGTYYPGMSSFAGIVATDQGMLLSFELAMVALALGQNLNDFNIMQGRGAQIGGAWLGMGTEMGLRPIAPKRDPRYNLLKTHTLQTLLAQGVDPSLIRDRNVIIGPVTGSHALYISYQGLTLPTVIWSAWTINSALQGYLIQVPGWFDGVQRMLIVLTALVLLTLSGRHYDTSAGVALQVGVAIFLVGLVVLMMLGLRIFLPLLLPALMIVFVVASLGLYRYLYQRINEDRLGAADAYRQLGSHLQSQGQLDQAFALYQRCQTKDDLLKQQLYMLGQDFERRRLYARALDVYEYLSRMTPDYRDINVRFQRLKPLAASRAPKLMPNTGAHRGKDLILDGNSLEKPTIGRYQIERQLGRGAMGIVYLGVDPKISRKVAIKTLALSREFEPEVIDQVKTRFFREAEASGRLTHKNIVTIYDVGEEHDLAFIAMDFLEGLSLDHFTKLDTLLPIEEVLSIGAQIADGLDYAHAQQVVHRDIKPANIMYNSDTGSVKITDFGIASLTDSSNTRTGTVLGTPAFMSPEQISGKRIDGRSDLFSLGVTLYYLLCAKLPFTAESMAALVYQITQTQHLPVTEQRPELGPLVNLIINKCLQKEPEKRYQNGAALAKALRDCSTALKNMPKTGQFGTTSPYYHGY